MTPAPLTVHLGADHAAVDLKNELADRLRDAGHTVQDHGPATADRVDYPDYAEKVGRAIQENDGHLGILVCGSGIGMSISANKLTGIRAAHVQDPLSARLSRQHNDANVLCLGARILGPELAWDIVENWLSASFEGGRHTGRVDKIRRLESR